LLLSKQALPSAGKPEVVLVADRTLSAEYKMLFEGIFATMQTTQVPEFVMRRLVSPAMKADKAGRAWAAVLGLRRIESALLAGGELNRNNVVCTTPESLGKLLGPWLKAVLVSSSDPLGQGMSNTTTDNFWKGQLYTRFWMNRMMDVIRKAKEQYDFKVIGGGAGAWQWANNPSEAQRQGFDTIFEGYFETQGPKLIADILGGRPIVKHICEHDNGIESIRPIKGASLLGIVELSRGCGKGCKFCSTAGKKMEHLPIETIVADLHTNVSQGINAVVSGSEDFFRYGGKGGKPDFDKLHELLVEMKKVKGLSFMQIDHGNISSVMQLSDEQLKEIRRLLTWQAKCDYLWVNMGIESANGHLVSANSAGKLSPFGPDDWEEVVREAADRMVRNGFFPVFSIILGLPGETPEDVAQTLKLVKHLTTRRTVIFPIFYEPVLKDEIENGQRFRLEDMRLDHLELYRTCYEQNFKWVPRMFWDNQRAAGVGPAKRLLIRMLGKTEVRAWRKAFRQIQNRLQN